jgi:hypothetical protein
VHRSAPATAESVGKPEDLSERPSNRDMRCLGQATGQEGVETRRHVVRELLGEHVVVSPMGRRDTVLGLERQSHADGNSLLSDARVKRAVHE